jgi:hypothetical protein
MVTNILSIQRVVSEVNSKMCYFNTCTVHLLLLLQLTDSQLISQQYIQGEHKVFP